MTSLHIPLSVSCPRSPSPAIPGAWPGTPLKELQQSAESVPTTNRHAAEDAHEYRSLADAQSPDSVISDLRSCDSTLAAQESVSTLWSKYNTSPSLTLSAETPNDSINDGLCTQPAGDEVNTGTPSAPSQPEIKLAAVADNDDIKLRGASLSRTLSLELPHTPPSLLKSRQTRTSMIEPSPAIPSTPSSPIMFASPASSRLAHPFPTADQLFDTSYPSSGENEVSRSWDTSYGSEILDGPIACITRHASYLASSPDSYQARGSVLDSGYTASPESNMGDLSSVEMDASPVLARLPLPIIASHATQSNLEINSSLSPNPSRITQVEPWTLSLSAASFDYFGSEPFSARSPRSHSLTLSPVSSYGVEIGMSGHNEMGDLAHGHAIILPRTSFSPVSSPDVLEGHHLALTDANVLGLSTFSSQDLADTGATEYAAAVVSSAWGSDGHSEPPRAVSGLVPDTYIGGVASEPRNTGPANEQDVGTEESGVSSLRITDLVDIKFQPSRGHGVLSKVKAYGRRMKKLLTRYKRSTQVFNEGRPIPQPTNHQGDVRGETPACVLRSDLPSLAVQDHIPLPLAPPPGLNPSSPSKARPSLSPQTFASPDTPLPAIRFGSPSTPQSIPLVDPAMMSRVRQKTSPNVHRLSFVNSTHTYPRPSSPHSSQRLLGVVPPNSVTNSSLIQPTNSVSRRYSYADACIASGQRGVEFEPSSFPATGPRAAWSTANTAPAISRDLSIISVPIKRERRRFSLSAVSNLFRGS